jgi:signal peptidase II
MSAPTKISKRLGITLILGILALDQLSKYWILNIVRLPEIGQIDVSAFFDLTMVWNYGVSFGALRADASWERWALVALSLTIATVFSVWLMRATRNVTILALALVIGGAIGNVIDRIRFGAVADFLDFSAMYFPWVFNVADSAITIGALLLAYDMFKNPDEAPQSEQKDVS